MYNLYQKEKKYYIYLKFWVYNLKSLLLLNIKKIGKNVLNLRRLRKQVE